MFERRRWIDKEGDCGGCVVSSSFSMASFSVDFFFLIIGEGDGVAHDFGPSGSSLFPFCLRPGPFERVSSKKNKLFLVSPIFLCLQQT